VVLREEGVVFPRECCICIEEFTTSEAIVATTCNHVFHRECCDQWLTQSRTCPICRTDIISALDDVSSSNSNSNEGTTDNVP